MSQNKKFFYTKNRYEDLTDEQILEEIKNGDEKAQQYLLEKYHEFVNIRVGKYFLIGAEREDIVQEGMIGLYKAIQNYNVDKQSSFKSFANLCVERQLITAIKSSNRQKHIPLNSSISLNTAAYDNDDNIEWIEIFNNKMAEDPLDTITKKEYYNEIETKVNKNLSKFEKKVLGQLIKGESYMKIAEKLDSPIKSVDNAIQRIRKKALKIYQ